MIIYRRKPNIFHSGDRNYRIVLCQNRVCGNYLINIYLGHSEFLETITWNLNSHVEDFISST